MTGKARKAELAGRMQQAAARPAASVAKPARAAAPRSKPVRLSVDLAPAAYRGLIDYCHQAAKDLGVARINGVDVLRALLAELSEDGQLAERIRGRIAAN